MSNSPSLNSLHILVTRPAGFAEPLCREIEHYGGKATHYPVIEITAPDDTEKLLTTIGAVNRYDIALFISPTAVTQTDKHLNLSTLQSTIGAIGTATLSALENKHLSVDIKPSGNNSELLLQHKSLQSNIIKNKHIIVFKGEGGRTLLTDTLRSRGADVFNANIYKRIIPNYYSALTKATLQTINFILVSSGEGLHNLLTMTDDKQYLKTLTIIVPGERCKNIAKTLGFKSIITTNNATNQSFITRLLELNTTSL